ncbi:MAG: TonB-dependent siderophore receptor [Burkholderiaceae bacterium]|jgi:outer membrane receptor for ferric coprogen and ferric-rhodotorulic acid|nr:TonB-dependent siderophore receptor [Burkholderiaceae bacterium]
MFKKTLLCSAVLSATVGAHAQQAPNEDNAQTLPSVSVHGRRVVDAESDGIPSYKADASTVGTKTATPMKEIPQSISVITQERIRDQNLRTNQDVLQQVPSVGNAQNPEGFISIRGFSAQTLVNGVPAGGLVGRTQADIAVFDRVEVLKGPAGLMAGSGSPGGAINYEFKKPRREFRVEGTLGIGSDKARNAGVDITGPINADGSLRARGVLFQDKRDEFVDVEKRQRTSLYGVLEYDFTSATTASLGYYQMRNKGVQSFRQGLPAYTDGSLLWDVDRRTSLTQDWSDWRFKASWLLVDLTHQFNDDWSAKLSYRQGKSATPSWYSYPGSDYYGSSCALPPFSGVVKGDPNGGKQCFTTSYYDDINEYKNFDVFVAGKLPLLGYKHDVVLGFNSERDSFLRAPFATAGGQYDFVNDVFNPNPHVIDRPPMPPIAYGDPSITRTHGFYLRSTLQLTDWLKAPLGGRLTWVKQSDGEESAKREFTPYAGLVAEFNKNVSVYASYTEIFSPSTYARAFDPANPAGQGTRLPHQKGKQYEIGVKSSWLDNRLFASAAIYNLTLDNTTRSDPDHPGFSIPTGQQRTRGFEFDVNGEVQPGWNVGLAYARMDAKYTKSDSGQGQRVSNTPRDAINLYTNYRFPQEGLKGLSVGGGLRHVGSILGDVPGGRGGTGPRLKAPSHTTVSLRAAYQITPGAQLAINIDNLFDKRYWQGLGSVTGGNYYGAPRSVMATLRVEY